MIYEAKDLPSYFKDMVVDYISLVPCENTSTFYLSHSTTSLDSISKHPDDRNCTNYLLLYDAKNKMMKKKLSWETSFSTYITILMAKV
jgi:hypothetical protein